MYRRTLFSAIAFGALSVLFAQSADAQAIMPARTGIDPNTFIVGHPASPRWKVVHSNAEHPAVLVARSATPAVIDPNTFIVQPPASVQWLPGAEQPTLIAQAR